MAELIIWSGWQGGIGVGLVVVAMFWLTGKALGASSAYGEACGVLGQTFYRSGSFAGPKWRLFFAAGIVGGGLIAAWTSTGTWALSWDMGTLYSSVLPASPTLRALVLTSGGVMIGFGARAAGGCQSGHAITGMALLNPPSILAGGLFFVGGIVAVQSLFAWVG
ncbi:MAG TPA: hypothetical protein DCQ06_02025 [Myxococcales bacterium]|nr:hypothetical protein [Myxococcales bacterium]HAN30351.1 hypothetical protein [Myxococcales bacterium]